MGNISNYLESKILDHVFRQIEYKPPEVCFLGLVSDRASEQDLEEGSLEHEIDGYQGDRKEVEFNPPAQEEGKGTVKSVASARFVQMPPGAVRYGIVCDSIAPGTGNILYWLYIKDGQGNIVTREAVEGDTLEVPAEQITLKLD